MNTKKHNRIMLTVLMVFFIGCIAVYAGKYDDLLDETSTYTRMNQEITTLRHSIEKQRAITTASITANAILLAGLIPIAIKLYRQKTAPLFKQSGKNLPITPISSTIIFSLALITALLAIPAITEICSLILYDYLEFDGDGIGMFVMSTIITVIYARFHTLYRRKLAAKAQQHNPS